MRFKQLGIVVAALVALVGCLLLTPSAGAQGSNYSYQQVTVSTSAVSIAAATLSGKRGCVLRVESDSIRYRQDGTAPTSSVGMPIAAGEVMEVDSVTDLVQAQFIRSGSGDATLNVACWRQ